MVNGGSMKPYYEEKGITIYNCDCREVLPDLPPVDLICTDPPYNCKKDYGTYQDNLSTEEYQSFMADVVSLSRKVATNQFWVAPRYQMLFFLTLFPDSHLIVIRRGARGPLRGGGWTDQFETALAVGKPSKPDLDLWEGIRLKGEGYYFREKTYGHPGYTPLPIMRKAIGLLSIGSICDPFCGTGTSLFAAKNIGRRAVGCEISEAYCEISAKRLSQEVFDFG
ncbi:MAG: site-specific DNA-methyltransferase [Candidatus Zambryskibacteria bacterium]|nr:site-specific DNA-methyltransferase [Candidatus Zambryskibacteria bacterium]